MRLGPCLVEKRQRLNKLEHSNNVLQDLMLRHGWRTGAIVPELEVETRVVNTEQYAQSLTWLQALTGLLERLQVSARRGMITRVV